MFKAVSTPIVVSAPFTSLSMVEATPTTGNPVWERAWAPESEPLPPITTRPSMLFWPSTRSAQSRPSGVRKSCERALPSIVPPR